MPNTPKCTSCQEEIPVGKYYELYDKGGNEVGRYCPLCGKKVSAKYEPLIKKGEFKLAERERETNPSLNQIEFQ